MCLEVNLAIDDDKTTTTKCKANEYFEFFLFSCDDAKATIRLLSDNDKINEMLSAEADRRSIRNGQTVRTDLVWVVDGCLRKYQSHDSLNQHLSVMDPVCSNINIERHFNVL